MSPVRQVQPTASSILMMWNKDIPQMPLHTLGKWRVLLTYNSHVLVNLQKSSGTLRKSSVHLPDSILELLEQKSEIDYSEIDIKEKIGEGTRLSLSDHL